MEQQQQQLMQLQEMNRSNRSRSIQKSPSKYHFEAGMEDNILMNRQDDNASQKTERAEDQPGMEQLDFSQLFEKMEKNPIPNFFELQDKLSKVKIESPEKSITSKAGRQTVDDG